MSIISYNEISGAIGLSILENKETKLFIFYDQHNNNNYCNSRYSEFLNNIFIDIIDNDNILILLEELLDYGKEDEIITLWKETKHTVDFKTFFLDNRHRDNVLPFDLRTLLFPCNIYIIKEIIDNKDTLININNLIKLKEFINNVTVKEYFYIILYFFNLTEKNEEYHTKYNNSIKHIKIIKKKIIDCFKNIYSRDNNLGNLVMIHYKKIKGKVKQFKSKIYDKNKNNLLKDLITSSNNDISIMENYIYKDFLNNDIDELYSLFDYINLVSDSLMEFYGILLIICHNKKFNFLHSGLAHSSNIVWLFKNLYNYDLVESKGLTEINLNKIHNIYDIPDVTNCLKIK